MKKYIATAITLLLTASVVFGGDASAVREEVWNRYLSPTEKAALAAMAPVDMEGDKTSGENSSDPAESRKNARLGFVAMAKEYARSAPSVTVTPYDNDGVKGSWLEPSSFNREKVILYLHGGAYQVGTDLTPQSITAMLATEAGVRCFSLDYPLAPEHLFPAAVHNAVKAYRMLLGEGIDPGNIVVSGDSAGGGLSVALLLSIRDAGLPMPAGAYLLSPWTDLTHSGDSQISKGFVDAAITHDFITEAAAVYAGGHELQDPLISPVFADLRGLPPLFVQVGSHERLLSDSVRLIRNAGEADVPATLTIWPGYPHVFQFYHRDLDGGRKALREGARFVREVLSHAVEG